MQTHELLFVSFKVYVGHYTPEKLAKDTSANMPWAEDHFQERVGGHPLNPGVQWAKWPWGHSADRFRSDKGQFSHTYMERIWPKFAGLTEGGDISVLGSLKDEYEGRHGIRYAYGDLMDVASHLANDQLSRQAFLPIWFPEDTGVIHGERVPCTLGYHFIVRDDKLHMVYYLRSCDFIRHFADDCYLSVRLQQWMGEKLGLGLGTFVAHITSLHVFRNDFLAMKEGKL